MKSQLVERNSTVTVDRICGRVTLYTQQLSNSATQQLSNSATRVNEQNSHFRTQLKTTLSFSFSLIALIDRRYAFLAFSSWILAACSLDASIVSTAIPSSALTANRTSPDFVSGEVVTTSAGFEVRGAFGEIPDSALMGNGLQIQGVVK